MSDPFEPEAIVGDTEEVDAVVVVPAPPSLPARQARGAVVPAVQAAAVAATGFMAGAAVVGLVNRHQHRRDLARGRSPRRLGARSGPRASSRTSGELVQIVSSRSLLVDVHLLGGRD